jgi:hypothetical protein
MHVSIELILYELINNATDMRETQMETPYSPFRERLEEYLDLCGQIRQSIMKMKKSNVQIDIGSLVGEFLAPNREDEIYRLAQGLKSDLRITEYNSNIIFGGIARDTRQIIETLPTGRRKSDLKISKQRYFLKKLTEAVSRKSFNARMNAMESLLNQIIVELTSLEIIWKPRTKVIPRGRALLGMSEIESIVSRSSHGFLKVCDPYISFETLVMLEPTPKDIPIEILTVKIQEPDKTLKYLDKMKRLGHDITIVQIQGGTKEAPHDRFIVTHNKGWQIGTSIKDIGKRESTIVEIDNVPEVQQMIDEYLSGSRSSIRQI